MTNYESVETNILNDAYQLRRDYSRTEGSGHNLCALVVDTIRLRSRYNHPLADQLADILTDDYKALYAAMKRRRGS